MNTLRILTLCLITTIGFAQKKQSKTSQSIKVNKDVVVDLNTNYVQIEIDTWNKDYVGIEAYVESTKLSDEELKKALKAWNLNIDASMDRISILSEGGRRAGLFSEGSYDDALKSLELSLAELPELPEMPNMANFPDLPDLPEMPKFPELPELPDGVTKIQFDYDRYQKEGEKYLTEWSKKYKKEGGKELQKSMETWAKEFSESGYQEKMEQWSEEYGKRFEGKWAKDMEKWGAKFGKNFEKNMEKWGEEFGESFGKDMEKWGEELGKKMEAWGERFGKQMEKRAESMEKPTEAEQKRAEAMENRARALAERNQNRLEYQKARAEQLAARRAEMELKRASIFSNGYSSKSNSNVKRLIKIKMPKKAKLKLNVRHGELKIVSLLDNIKGSLSYTNLLADNIGGRDTSINVFYSNVLVNDWKNGSLSLKYVDDALLKNVQNLTLNSNSSNINIDNLSGNNIIDGSFGELTIHNILNTFNNLNIVLENSEAWLKLPSVDYSLLFRGERSKFNNENTKTKTINGTSGKSIVINAKYSNINVD
ncbi:MAG: cell envelope integrity protein TolA [Winogradskyella sp.]|uniref:hypothetical protein n=1 Tax=Winogradskyella sp. TaxID=1883156 RepID=UPI001801DA7D|nr:hypothetical protein [Winogradskyella sp.]MBT8245965.1 hypothetical protein [Winogradskyella sp.]NNK23254.1 cell envelope integrity protein TolA [Winogradskyella sp.]